MKDNDGNSPGDLCESSWPWMQREANITEWICFCYFYRFDHESCVLQIAERVSVICCLMQIPDYMYNLFLRTNPTLIRKPWIQLVFSGSYCYIFCFVIFVKWFPTFINPMEKRKRCQINLSYGIGACKLAIILVSKCSYGCLPLLKGLFGTTFAFTFTFCRTFGGSFINFCIKNYF